MGQGHLTTLNEVLEQSRISKEVMDKYVLNTQDMQKTKIEIENALIKIGKRLKLGEQLWKGEKFAVSKHMLKKMAFLDAK